MINKRIYKKSSLAIAMILVAVVIAVLGCDILMKNTRYNPYHEDISSIETLDEGGISGKKDYYAIMQNILIENYVNLAYPGMYYDAENEIKDKGFGNYELSGKIERQFGGKKWGEGRESFKLSQSTYYLPGVQWLGVFLDSEISDQQSNLEDGAYAFGDENFLKNYREEISKMLDEIEKMPDSSRYEVYVTYKNPIALKNWNATQIPNYEYVYALTYHHANDYWGFNVSRTRYIEKFNEYYPEYYLTDDFEEITFEQLKLHYQSLLQMMLDHPNFISTVSSRTVKDFQDEIERLQRDEVEIRGYLAYVSKDEIKEILQDSNSAYVYIHDVKYSSFEK